ncbi:ABC transporter ATP-binding protein [bacterium]|nr:ABC transporter ATP-binding protein [candidate division CSSED10-310 bacterium]
MNAAIQVSQLTKTYRIHSHRQLLATQPFSLLRRSPSGDLLVALDTVSFEIPRGRIVGIIGHNGSGKSTLLKILSGVTRQDSGTFTCHGRVTSLLELGVGFETELTGRENIYLYGSLIGLSREWIEEKERDIIAFAGIPDYIDLPIKTYSSGMLIRLAFSTAIHTEPDILLLDEVLGVGDDEFRHRSFQAIQKAVERGVTVVIVSHGLAFVGSFCSMVMCLHQGRVAAMGPAEHVVQVYMDLVSVRDMIGEVRNGNTRLRLTQGAFHVEHGDRMLSVGKGIGLNLRKWDADFSSTEAGVDILELNDRTACLRLSWGHWDLDQIWRIELVSPVCIRWIIENGDHLHEEVDGVEIEAMVSGTFRSYILPEEIRAFPETVHRGFNMEYLLARMKPRAFAGVCESLDDRHSVILDFSDCPRTGSTQVITGGNLMPGHILKRDFPTQSGNRQLSITIHLPDREATTSFFATHRHRPGVASGSLSMEVVDDGLHLVWNGSKLTCDPGLHVVSGMLTDEPPPDWESITTPSGLILRATHRILPLVSVWTLHGDGSGISWEVALEILDRIPAFHPRVSLDFDSPVPDALEFSPPTRKGRDGLELPVDPGCTSIPGVPARLRLAGGIVRTRGALHD